MWEKLLNSVLEFAKWNLFDSMTWKFMATCPTKNYVLQPFAPTVSLAPALMGPPQVLDLTRYRVNAEAQLVWQMCGDCAILFDAEDCHPCCLGEAGQRRLAGTTGRCRGCDAHSSESRSPLEYAT